MTNKIVKTKCPLCLDEITIEILDPDELILTRKRGLDEKYRHIPRKETKYPKYLISCPSLETPHLADLSSTLRESLVEEGRWWCKKKKAVCPHEHFISSLLARASLKR